MVNWNTRKTVMSCVFSIAEKTSPFDLDSGWVAGRLCKWHFLI